MTLKSPPRTHLRTPRTPVYGACLALAVLVIAACGGRPAPFVGPRTDAPRRVLVFVPGITGSVLRDSDTGKVVWGRGRNLVCPRDGGYNLAMPIAGNAGRRLEVDGILRSLRLLFLHRPVYQPLVDLFEANGYQLGDLDAPRAEDDLYLFAYDWRQDNVASAQRLFESLEAVRRSRGDERLAIDLVCQSNGGYVCRWLSRFGGASLEAVEAGEAAPPPSLDVHQVVLVGTANGGSLRTLREMTRGRRYIPGLGKRFAPEAFFTIPAFFQDLPTYRRDLFVDLEGSDLELDVFDPASWEVFGWSIFSPRAKRSLGRRQPAPALFGDLAARRAHLASALDRARRLHTALAEDTALAASMRLHLIQNIAWPTPDRAVVLPAEGGGWELYFTGDESLAERQALLAAVTADGDGHAPVASQLHLTPSERRIMVGGIFPVEAEHFETILQPAAHRRMIEILARP